MQNVIEYFNSHFFYIYLLFLQKSRIFVVPNMNSCEAFHLSVSLIVSYNKAKVGQFSRKTNYSDNKPLKTPYKR